MARRKGTGNADAAGGNDGADAVTTAGSIGSFSSLLDLQTREGRTAAASLAFAQILHRDDGWLRCVPGAPGESCYWKWKFTRGEHKGKYVMFVTGAPDWVAGIVGLAEKLNEVDDGRRKPAYDTFYDPR